jgi:hypothetical protein
MDTVHAGVGFLFGASAEDLTKPANFFVGFLLFTLAKNTWGYSKHVVKQEALQTNSI